MIQSLEPVSYIKTADPRVLIVIPAYNEEKTIASVIHELRLVAPMYDRLIINDGSADGTGVVVDQLQERQLELACNLGYGLALQTGIIYALESGYDIVVCIDADGQHRPRDLPGLVQTLIENDADMVIGSRYCLTKSYKGPIERQIGQRLFSYLTRFLIGYRIYDTTSGFKALNARACKMIVDGTFMDFHIESIVRLSLFDKRIIEYPVIVEERTAGVSMHSFASVFRYPIKTILLTLVTMVDAFLTHRKK